MISEEHKKLFGLDDKIIQKENEVRDGRKMRDALAVMELYQGPDRIISSKEAQETIKENRTADRKVYFSNLRKFDDLTGGFREGQLITLSAPTGQGKTQFLQELTHSFSERGVPCLWFSYEMGQEELFDRFAQEIPHFYLPSKMRESNLDWMKRRVLEGIAKYDTKVIFIDHLHFLLQMEDMAQAKNLSLLIGMLMRELKKMAIATNTIIFLVSHMKMTMLEKTPTIDDLRDSSFVGQESDYVVMIWRHKQKDTASPSGWTFTNESRLMLVKNRPYGRLGHVKLLFQNNRFTEL